MSSYTFALQHTGRPYAPAENIPSSAWRELSRHTSKRAAYNALRLARREMTKACGVGAWNDHHRVVALKTHQVRYLHVCMGWLDAAGRSQPCDAEAHTTATWEAGQPAPPVETPQGWAGPSQCAACAERERASERVT
jgi:hypothetical protein